MEARVYEHAITPDLILSSSAPVVIKDQLINAQAQRHFIKYSRADRMRLRVIWKQLRHLR